MKPYKIKRLKKVRSHVCENCSKKGFVYHRGYKLCYNCITKWKGGNNLKCGLKYIPKHHYFHNTKL